MGFRANGALAPEVWPMVPFAPKPARRICPGARPVAKRRRPTRRGRRPRKPRPPGPPRRPLPRSGPPRRSRPSPSLSSPSGRSPRPPQRRQRRRNRPRSASPRRSRMSRVDNEARPTLPGGFRPAPRAGRADRRTRCAQHSKLLSACAPRLHARGAAVLERFSEVCGRRLRVRVSMVGLRGEHGAAAAEARWVTWQSR